MKRIFFLALLAGIACSVFSAAWAYANPCDYNVHYALCNEPEKCANCGKTVADGIEIAGLIHQYDDQWSFSRHFHWHTCINCGAADEKQQHYANCTSPNTCADCEKTEADGIVIDEVFHRFELEETSQYYDTEMCYECGKTRQYKHWTTCDYDMDRCISCDRSVREDGIVIGTVYHSCVSMTEPEYNETGHWWICPETGETVDQGGHVADCASPGLCRVCGATEKDNGITIARVEHAYDIDDVKTNAISHWWVCSQCGKTVDQGYHEAMCTNPGVCEKCGKSEKDGMIINLTKHNMGENGEMHWNGKEHWFFCVDCQQEYRRAHFTACYGKPGECTICGCPFEGEITHFNNNPDEYQQVDNAYHRFRCVYCGQEVLEKHDMAEGKCSYCGYEQKAGPVPGDVNGEGKLDGRDLLRLARYLAGGSVSIDEAAADVTGDGKIDGRDLLRIARYLAGQNVNLAAR